MLRKLKRIAMLFLISLCAYGCFMPEAIVQSDRTAQSLEQQGMLASRRLDLGSNSLHYMLRASSSSALVVFIHGTPGDWKIFSPQLESRRLQKSAILVALDRPGWGDSLADAFQGRDTLSEQSAIIGPALSKLKAKYTSTNLIIVGHSLGGSLVAKLAMEYPDLVDAVVILAGDLTDDFPAAYWYNEVASWRAVSWLVPKTMQQANREVIALEAELHAMKNGWAKITVPILVVQGEKDSLVDPRNADFAEALRTSSAVRVIRKQNSGHLFHLSEAQEANALIEKVIQRGSNDFFGEGGDIPRP